VILQKLKVKQNLIIEENITYKDEADEQTGLRGEGNYRIEDKTENPAIITRKGAEEPVIYNVPVAARRLLKMAKLNQDKFLQNSTCGR
jgi:DNA-directed RNA polymerase subunit beta'